MDREIAKSQASLYSQYQLMLDGQWIGHIGARYDRVKTENSGKTTSRRTTLSRSDNQLSLSAGVMYLADNGLSPYASYSQSFEVISTIDTATNNLYKPLKGEQIEVGIKYLPENIDGYLNIALFDITQKNALVTNPATFVATQTGEVTAKGLEIEAAVQLNAATQLRANYTYTQTETDETFDKGKQLAALIPKHRSSAWIDVNANTWLPGLRFCSGVRYIGQSKDNPKSSNLNVPSVVLWDAMVSYQVNDSWQAQMNINNILDKEYISGCDYWCYFGQSRY